MLVASCRDHGSDWLDALPPAAARQLWEQRIRQLGVVIDAYRGKMLRASFDWPPGELEYRSRTSSNGACLLLCCALQRTWRHTLALARRDASQKEPSTYTCRSQC